MVRITNWDRARIRRTYLNYRDLHPTFSFRVEPMQRSKLDKLAKIDKISTNEFARKIIQMYLSNELVKKTEDLQTEKVKLQIEKLKAEIKYMQIINTLRFLIYYTVVKTRVIYYVGKSSILKQN